MRIRLTSTFDLRLLGLLGVMNIINGIARGGSPCVRVWPLRSECCGRGAPTNVVCAECMKMCCLDGKNSVVKGLKAYNLHAMCLLVTSVPYNLHTVCLLVTKVFIKCVSACYQRSLH